MKDETGFVPSNYVKKIKPSILESLKNIGKGTLGRKKSVDRIQVCDPLLLMICNIACSTLISCTLTISSKNMKMMSRSSIHWHGHLFRKL